MQERRRGRKVSTKGGYILSSLREERLGEKGGEITISPYGGTYIIYCLCIRNQNSLIMETREYFEKVMQDYNQNRKGRSLRKYCKEETVDYDWLIEFKKSYRSNQLQPDENKKLGEGEFIALTVEENFVPEKLNDINFGDYIEDILTRLMEGEQDFMSLIPCNYNSNKKVNVKAA